MTFNYNNEDKTQMLLVLENGISVKGEFVDLRIATETLPPNKEWYQIRHADDDGSEPASLKRGCVVVNFFGTFICDPIDGIADGEEIDILEWNFED